MMKTIFFIEIYLHKFSKHIRDLKQIQSRGGNRADSWLSNAKNARPSHARTLYYNETN